MEIKKNKKQQKKEKLSRRERLKVIDILKRVTESKKNRHPIDAEYR